MTTAHDSQGSRNVYGDPWNDPATTAAKIKTTLAVGLFFLLVLLFAAAASTWVSTLGPERAWSAQESSTTPKSSTSNRASFAEDPSRLTAGSSVSVLAPRNMTAAQAAEFASRFRETPDGYFARVSYDGYDVVINGARGVGRRTQDASQVRISETENGLSAAFSRDGADYQIEFACHGPGNEAGDACISEVDARAFVAALAP